MTGRRSIRIDCSASLPGSAISLPLLDPVVATVTPDKLTQAYVDARYFERNVAVVQVLLDRAAIESGAAGKGEPYKFVHLGHGFCANPYWAQCQHRMACQHCDFYVPGDSTKAQSLEANAHNQRLLEQIPVTETEPKALAGDQAALEQWLEPAQCLHKTHTRRSRECRKWPRLHIPVIRSICSALIADRNQEQVGADGLKF